MTNILALDQASVTSGWAVFDKEEHKLIDFGKFTIDSSLDNGKRLNLIRQNILDLIYKFNIKEIAFEDIQLQSTNNPKTYKVLAQVQGIIMELAVSGGLPYEIVPPSHWRAHLNLPNGKGIKREQQKKYAQDYALKKYNKSVSQDEADALCIGTYYITKNNSAF